MPAGPMAATGCDARGATAAGAGVGAVGVAVAGAATDGGGATAVAEPAGSSIAAPADVCGPLVDAGKDARAGARSATLMSIDLMGAVDAVPEVGRVIESTGTAAGGERGPDSISGTSTTTSATRMIAPVMRCLMGVSTVLVESV